MAIGAGFIIFFTQLVGGGDYIIAFTDRAGDHLAVITVDGIEVEKAGFYIYRTTGFRTVIPEALFGFFKQAKHLF